MALQNAFPALHALKLHSVFNWNPKEIISMQHMFRRYNRVKLQFTSTVSCKLKYPNFFFDIDMY